MHKIENRDLKDALTERIADRMVSSYKSTASRLLTFNSILTVYQNNGGLVLLLGENARYMDCAALKNGAFLDIRAAEILQQRGIDVGLIDAQPYDPEVNTISHRMMLSGIWQIYRRKSLYATI